MTNEEKDKIKGKIISCIASVEEEIGSLKESTKPIPPDNAIGRLTRMDAIQGKSINEAVLRRAKIKLTMLENALGRVDDSNFGECGICEEPIPFQRMLLMPESTRCVECVTGKR